MSNSLQSHGLEPTGLLYPWNSPGKDTGVGCHFLLQGIFPTQGSNPDLLHCRQTLYCLSHQGSFVVKAMVFLVVMYRCESWTIKKAECPRTDAFKLVLEKTLESPSGSKETKLVDPKGNQPWIFIGRTDVEAEAPVLWPPGAKSQLTGKDLDSGKDWGQKEKRATEDEMVKWHYQLNGHEFEQIPGDSEGQGSLAAVLQCCSPWGHKE